MGLNINYSEDQIPLDEDEIDGLLILNISTKAELDEFEQQNIEEGIIWTLSKRTNITELFSEHFIKNLHKKMYQNVWSWAGEFRKTNKNIGVDRWKIATELKVLIDDVNYWFNNNSYSPDEVAIRFKHRIVSIHCFSNGNGRHSRLMADLIIEKLYKMPIFSWGSKNLSLENDLRKTYLKALKHADKGDYKLLLTFARS